MSDTFDELNTLHPGDVRLVTAPAPTDQNVILRIIERAVTAPEFDVNRIQQLLDVKERWDANEARRAFTVAMAAFKADPPKIVKNKHVKFTTLKGTTEYDHASHSEVVEKIAAGLGKHGMSHRWTVTQDQGKITVTCIITHSLGHSEQVTLFSGADDSGSKNSIQAIGSAVTYLQRYTLLAATGLTTADAEDDDDGRGSEEDDRPPLDPQIVEALKVAAGAGRIALEDAWKALPKETRALITLHYGEEWETLKRDAGTGA